MLPRCTLLNSNRNAAIQRRLRTRTEASSLATSPRPTVLRVEQAGFPNISVIAEIFVSLNHSPLIVGPFVGVGHASEQATSSRKARKYICRACSYSADLRKVVMKHGLYLRQQIQLPSAWVDLAIKIGQTDMRKPRQNFRREIPSWTLPEFQRNSASAYTVTRVKSSNCETENYLPNMA